MANSPAVKVIAHGAGMSRCDFGINEGRQEDKRQPLEALQASPGIASRLPLSLTNGGTAATTDARFGTKEIPLQLLALPSWSSSPLALQPPGPAPPSAGPGAHS